MREESDGPLPRSHQPRTSCSRPCAGIWTSRTRSRREVSVQTNPPVRGGRPKRFAPCNRHVGNDDKLRDRRYFCRRLTLEHSMIGRGLLVEPSSAHVMMTSGNEAAKRRSPLLVGDPKLNPHPHGLPLVRGVLLVCARVRDLEKDRNRLLPNSGPFNSRERMTALSGNTAPSPEENMPIWKSRLVLREDQSRSTLGYLTRKIHPQFSKERLTTHPLSSLGSCRGVAPGDDSP